MGHRSFNAIVVLFWFSTMTWLVVAKVLPPLNVGEPPSYSSIYAVEPDSAPQPICWEMLWNDRPLGWAVNRISRTESGVTEVRSIVHFSRVPVDEMTPAWIRPLLRRAVRPMGRLKMDVDSMIEISPLGRLTSFRSSLRASGVPEAMVVRGRVKDSSLKITVETGSMRQELPERFLPHDALVGDELSPQGRMPGLRVGQTWTVPVYSPLRPSTTPVEILQAKVEGYETLLVGEEPRTFLSVVYRADSGSILGGGRPPRSKLWVAGDGTVMKQVTNVFGSNLTFVRASDARAEEIVRAAQERTTVIEGEEGTEATVRLPGLDGRFGTESSDRRSSQPGAAGTKDN